MKNIIKGISIVSITLIFHHAGVSSQTLEEDFAKNSITSAYIDAGANEHYEEKIESVVKIINRHKKNFETGGELYKNLIKNYDGGQWIQYDESGDPYPVIAISNRYNSQYLITDSIPEEAEVVYVDYSIEELDALQQEIIPLFIEDDSILNKLIKSIVVDQRVNRVVIESNIDTSKEILKILKDFGIDGSKIIIDENDLIYENIGNLYSGSGTFIQDSSGYSLCTAGFFGRVDNSYDISITAGHCIPAITPGNTYLINRIWPQFTRPPLSSIGEFIGSKLVNEYVGNNIIKRDIGHYANANHIHNFIPVLAPPANNPITSFTASTSPGMMLCAFGAISQWRCGQVLSTGKIQADSRNVTIINTTEVSMCSRSGDSGGPGVFRNGSSVIGYAIAAAIRRPGASIGGGSPLEPDSNCFANSNVTPLNSITIFQPVVEYANRNNIVLKTF